MRTAVFVLLGSMILLPLVSAQGQDTTVSGPDVLKSIGPQEPYQDAPLAAIIVAGTVAIVILRGLHQEDGTLPVPSIHGEEAEPDDDVANVGNDE